MIIIMMRVKFTTKLVSRRLFTSMVGLGVANYISLFQLLSERVR